MDKGAWLASSWVSKSRTQLSIIIIIFSKPLLEITLIYFVSSLLHVGFLQLWRAGATPCGSAQASHCSGFSLLETGFRSTGFSTRGTWARSLWHIGLGAPQHVESSWTKDRTPVPCIGRWILSHYTIREVQKSLSLARTGRLHEYYLRIKICWLL